jgi:hypothetical protein
MMRRIPFSLASWSRISEQPSYLGDFFDVELRYGECKGIDNTAALEQLPFVAHELAQRLLGTQYGAGAGQGSGRCHAPAPAYTVSTEVSLPLNSVIGEDKDKSNCRTLVRRKSSWRNDETCGSSL